jgi:nucleotide-binding universal stress UspA family protein
LFQKILVALDASERAPAVLDVAVAMARALGARVYVLRVVTIPPEFPAAAAGSPTDALAARMAAQAMQDLCRLVAGAPDDIAAQLQPPIVRLGTPWKVILDTSDEEGVDLIVLGSHGYHGWDRVLGTTAAKVANLAKRSVLVVHDEGPADGGAPRDASP